jgi:hypothetical protein
MVPYSTAVCPSRGIKMISYNNVKRSPDPRWKNKILTVAVRRAGDDEGARGYATQKRAAPFSKDMAMVEPFIPIWVSKRLYRR